MYFPSQPLADGLDAVHGLYGRVKRVQLSNPSLVGGGMQPLLSIGVSTLTGVGSDHVPHMTTDSCMLTLMNIPFSLHENVITIIFSLCTCILSSCTCSYGVDWGDGSSWSIGRQKSLGPFQVTHQYAKYNGHYGVRAVYCSDPGYPYRKCCDSLYIPICTSYDPEHPYPPETFKPLWNLIYMLQLVFFSFLFCM